MEERSTVEDRKHFSLTPGIEKKDGYARPLSADDVQETDIFIGNLRPDLAPKALINRIQDLFEGEGVEVQENNFKCIHKGTKRPKHLFLRLESIEDKMRIIAKFDGFLDASVSMEGKTLKVKSRQNKKGKGEVIKLPEVAKVTSLPTCVPITLNAPITSIPNPITLAKRTCNQVNSEMVLRHHPSSGKGCLFVGQVLQSEDRNTEYKSGTGSYINKTLVRHVRKYACAFLNSEGGRLCVGISDDCVVHGIPCSRKQEDTARVLIDNVIKRFNPPVFPYLYTVTFVPVFDLSSSGQSDDETDEPLKVLEIKVKPEPYSPTLYENDKGEVYLRRDGSIQGPLKASQIIEWCRLRYAKETISDKKIKRSVSAHSFELNECKSIGSILSNHSESLKDHLKKRAEKIHEREEELRKMERVLCKRQHEVEKQLAALKESEGELNRERDPKKTSKKSETRRRPSSGVCSIL